MDHYTEELHDPKGQGQPPAYTTNNPSQDVNHMHHTMGHQMHGGMGQPMYVQQPTTMQPVGMMQPIGMMQPTGMIQPVGMMQPTGMMYAGPVVVPMVVGSRMGRQPAPATCPSCKETIVTKTEIKATAKTHMFAFIMVMFCLLPCALIPYVTDTCRDTDHYCPNCNSYIGSYVN